MTFGTRGRRLLCAVGTAVLTAGVLTACTHSSRPPDTAAGAPGPTPSAQAPAGSDTTFATTDAGTPAAPSLDGVAFARGHAWDITASAPAPGATVRFAVDAAVDLAKIGDHQPSTANLFVAVYEQPLDLWVPLPTTYDPATHTIAAVAPHFSRFRKYVVNPAEKVSGWIGDGAETVGTAAVTATRDTYHVAEAAVTGVMEFEQQIEDSVVSQIREAFFPPQEHADCSEAAPTITVTFQLDPKLTGCAVSENGRTIVHAENTLYVPFGVHVRTTGLPELGADSGLGNLIPAVYYLALGGTYLPPRGTAEFDVTDQLTAHSDLTTNVTLDGFALALQVILGMLNVAPPDEKTVTALETTYRAAVVAALKSDGQHLTLQDLFVELEVEVRKVEISSAPDQPLRYIRWVDEAMKCVTTSAATLANPSVDGVVATAKNCLSTAADVLEQELPGPVEGFVQVLDGISGLSNSVRAVFDFAEYGREPNTSLHVARTDGPNAYFVTPSGNIRCFDIEVFSHAGNPPGITCTVDQHTFVGPPCPFAQPGFNLEMLDTGPATAHGCQGDAFVPLVGALPRAVAYGETVPMAAGSCDVEPENVRCTNRAGHGFTVSHAAYATF